MDDVHHPGAQESHHPGRCALHRRLDPDGHLGEVHPGLGVGRPGPDVHPDADRLDLGEGRFRHLAAELVAQTCRKRMGCLLRVVHAHLASGQALPLGAACGQSRLHRVRPALRLQHLASVHPASHWPEPLEPEGCPAWGP